MSACSQSSVLMAVSTLATISVAGMVVGVTVKFNPFSSNDTSASLRGRDDKLITHLFWSTCGVRLTLAFSRLRDSGEKSFSKKKCEKRAGAGERQGGGACTHFFNGLFRYISS